MKAIGDTSTSASIQKISRI